MLNCAVTYMAWYKIVPSGEKFYFSPPQRSSRQFSSVSRLIAGASIGLRWAPASPRRSLTRDAGSACDEQLRKVTIEVDEITEQGEWPSFIAAMGLQLADADRGDGEGTFRTPSY